MSWFVVVVDGTEDSILGYEILGGFATKKGATKDAPLLANRYFMQHDKHIHQIDIEIWDTGRLKEVRKWITKLWQHVPVLEGDLS